VQPVQPVVGRRGQGQGAPVFQILQMMLVAVAVAVVAHGATLPALLGLVEHLKQVAAHIPEVGSYTGAVALTEMLPEPAENMAVAAPVEVLTRHKPEQTGETVQFW